MNRKKKQTPYKKHRGKHIYIYTLYNGTPGFVCKKCGKAYNFKVAFDNHKDPFPTVMVQIGKGMGDRVNKYLRKVLTQKPVTGTFTTYQNPLPKVGDTITMNNTKYRVIKTLNKRQSCKYEAVMEKIREL